MRLLSESVKCARSYVSRPSILPNWAAAIDIEDGNRSQPGGDARVAKPDVALGSYSCVYIQPVLRAFDNGRSYGQGEIMTTIARDVGVSKHIGSYSDAIEASAGLRWLFTSGTPGISPETGDL